MKRGGFSRRFFFVSGEKKACRVTTARLRQSNQGCLLFPAKAGFIDRARCREADDG
jgi:hypothetical protein